jgi:hypothetical protein
MLYASTAEEVKKQRENPPKVHRKTSEVAYGAGRNAFACNLLSCLS